MAQPASNTGRQAKQTLTGQNPSSLVQFRSPMEYLLLIRQRWWWGFLLGLLIAVPVSLRMLEVPVTYTSSGSVIFQGDERRALEVRAVSDVDPNLRFQAEFLRSGPFLDRVAATLTPDEVEIIQQGYLETLRAGEPPPHPRDIIGKIQVSILGDLRMLRISHTGRSPQEPVLIVDRVIDTFINALAEQTARTDTGAMAFLRNQAADLRQRIEDRERKFVEFRQVRNLVSIEDSQALIAARIATLTTAVTQVRTERMDLEPLLQLLDETEKSGGNFTELRAIAGTPGVMELLSERARLQAEFALLDRRYLERHPRVIENRLAQQSVEQRLAAAIERAVGTIRDRAKELADREARLRAELAKATDDQLELDKASVELGVMRREIDTDVRTLDRILAQISEQEIASQLAGANVRKWETPRPGVGSGPNRNQIFALAFLLVVGLAVALPIAVDLADTRLLASGDVETQLGCDLVGEIPALKAFERGASFLGSDQSNDVFLESFRGIYSQLTLQRKTGESGSRRLVLSSSIPGEGKSFVACNLAAVFGAHHERTIIVDCDFRRPTQHVFLRKPGTPGVRQWIESNESLPSGPDSLVPGIVEVSPNLWLFPAGGSTRHPTEILSHARFAQLVGHLSERFDVVIFDTPPIGLFPDALLVASHCDEALFIARFGSPGKSRIRDYIDRLRSTVPRFHGVVMNKMPENPRSPYYYRGYNYGAEKYVEYYKRGAAE